MVVHEIAHKSGDEIAVSALRGGVVRLNNIRRCLRTFAVPACWRSAVVYPSASFFEQMPFGNHSTQVPVFAVK